MNESILIIDDEKDVVAYLAVALKANGFKPLTALSAEEGLKILERTHPWVICLDIMMPKESGLSLYSRLKQDDKLKQIPVIIISGMGQENQFNFRDYIPDESITLPEFYLEKPVNPDEFIAAIKKVLAASHAKKGG